jgi:hypothetical protein
VLSAFVQFTDADGNVVPATFSNAQDTTRAAFLRWIPSNFTVFGVPLQGDDVPSYDFSFHIPSTASAATVFYGSLGLLGDPFCPEAVSGALLTVIFDIGLPVMSLALGIIPGLDALKNLAIEFIQAEVVQLLEAVIGGATDSNNPAERDGIFWADMNSSSASSTLAELGNRLLIGLLNSGLTPALIQTLGRVIAQDETLEMAGPLGVAFRVMAAGANVASLSGSISEVLACPAIFTNTVRLTQTTTVTLHHDPDDFQFPATARHYKVVLEYDDASSVTFVATGSISPPQSDPIVVSSTTYPPEAWSRWMCT